MTKRVLPGPARTTLLLCSAVLTMVGCTPPSSNEEPLDIVGSTQQAILSSTGWTHDTTHGKASDLAWGDYDGDGDLDLVIANEDTADPCRLFRNDGGSFTDVWQSATNKSQGLAWGDYDNDGDLDLAIANEGAPTTVYENQGPGGGGLATTLAWSSSSSYKSKALAWGDYDNDGDLDLAVANDNDPDELFQNDGVTSGGLLSMSAVTGWANTSQKHSTSLAWGDWDNDGDLDLAIGNHDGNQRSRVYRNDSGTLVDAWQSPSNQPEKTRGVAWGDWDGDGDLDLALANDDQENQVYENQALANNVHLQAQPSWSSNLSRDSQAVAWADWDGDGDLDLVFANDGEYNRLYENLSGQPGAGSARLSIHSLQWSWRSKKSAALAWADWDGDGDLDLAVANEEQDDYVYANTGNSPSLDWESSSAWSSTGLALGDVDGDGDLDLAVANSGSTPDLVFLNTNGTFSSAPDWSAANTASQAVAWGDVDGDGDLDLAVAVANGANLLYENQSGASIAAVPLALSSVWQSFDTDDSRSLAWGDYDRDGDLDLAIGNYGTANKIYENQGGTLNQTAVWVSTETDNTTSLAWGHLGSDLHLDLAAANDGGTNRVYSNSSGTLSQTALWNSNDSESTQDVAWGDFDGDGTSDLAFANRGSPDRIYRNNSGSLALAWTSSLSGAGGALSWTDLDGDGWLDLVVANYGAGAQGYRSVLGVLPSAPDFSSPLSEDTTDIVAADIDADGDVDLVQTNSGGKVQLERSFRIGYKRLAENPSYAVIVSPDATPVAGSLSAEIHEGATLEFSFVLYDQESDLVNLSVQYSTSGGAWTTATILDTTSGLTAATRGLSSSPGGTTHSMDWDLVADGIFSDTASLRVVIKRQRATDSSVSMRHGSLGTSSTPFRAWACFPRDADNDGYDTCGPDGPPGPVLAADCDDDAATNFPNNPEACDGLDNDCNTATFAAGGESDGDSDGVLACDDCDDADINNFPGNIEACDGEDNDCDSATEAGGSEADGDGDSSFACADCDDGDSNNFPGNTEVCDGADNDCNSTTSASGGEADADGDTFIGCNDCDDNPSTGANNYPGNTEVCDGADNDCDSTTSASGGEADADGDGSPVCADCDDSAVTNYPGNSEVCDGSDNDCDTATFATGGEDDSDGDGALACVDCDDSTATNFPGNTEICDGLDNDCNTSTFAPGGENDSDTDGSLACADCDDGDSNNFPDNAEVCDSADNDCDTTTDENVDGDGDGASTCDGDCNDSDELTFSGAEEICDSGIDNDCDPATDENVDGDGDGYSICAGDCVDTDTEIRPNQTEDCVDGIDNDCDGDVDAIDADCSGDDDDSAGDDDDSAGDDDDSAGDDDDSAGDDDDSAGDDDDATGDDDDGPAECVDEDQDSFCADVDCDDNDASVHPDAEEICNDGLDSNCNQLESEDLDEPHCWAVGCDCDAGTLSSDQRAPHPAWLLLLVVLAGLRRARRRTLRSVNSPARMTASLSMCLFAAFTLSADPANADTSTKGEEPPQSMDELRALLEEGRCVETQRWLKSTIGDSREASLWRLLADAERCLGHSREAILAYKHSMLLGGEDPTVMVLLESLRTNVSILDVSLMDESLQGSESPAGRTQLYLMHGEERLQPDWSGGRTDARFKDLPPTVPLILGHYGIGFEADELSIPPLEAGATRQLLLTPRWVGVGHLSLNQVPSEGVSVRALLPDGAKPLSMTEQLSVSAGTVPVEVESELGTTRTEVEIKSGAPFQFELIPSLPAGLKVSGLPAGASLRLFVEGPGGTATSQELSTKPQNGSIDPDTGVRLSASQEFSSLPGGTGGLFVSHPVLGTGVQDVVLAAGQNNVLTFDWRALEGVPTVAGAYSRWRMGQDLTAKTAKTAKNTRIAGIIAIAGAVSGAAFAAIAAGSSFESHQAKTAGLAAQAVGDDNSVRWHGERWLNSRRNQHGFAAGSAILSSMSLGSLSVAISFRVRSKRDQSSSKSWEPWAVGTP